MRFLRTLAGVFLLCLVNTVIAEESLLVCKGMMHSSLLGDSTEELSFTLIKKDGKIIRVVDNNYKSVYSLNKVNLNKKGESPIYVQLIVESGNIILRTERPADKSILDTKIAATGSFERDTRVGIIVGRCEAGKNLF
ncbi:MAG: hypothetical protein ACQ9ET_01705 [Nitrosomonadaceae bacterium]